MESIESDRGRLDVEAAHSAADMANLDLTNARRRSFSEPLKEFVTIFNNPEAAEFEKCLILLVDLSPRQGARHGHLSGRVLFFGGGRGRRSERLGRVDGDRSLALLVRANDAGHGVASANEIESDSLFEIIRS